MSAEDPLHEIGSYEFLSRMNLPPLPGFESDGEKLYWARSNMFEERREVDWAQLVAGGYVKPVYKVVEKVIYLIQHRERDDYWRTEHNSSDLDDIYQWWEHYTAKSPRSAWRLVKAATTEQVLEVHDGD